MQYDFASDNVAPMAPEALDAVIRANGGSVPAYGRDPVTQSGQARVRELLGAPDAVVRFVFSGTAANSLALSLIAQPFEAVLSHHEAHIRTDETGAPGLFTHGTGLIGLNGSSAKVDPEAFINALNVPEMAHRQPAVALSLSQSTEYGAVYSEDEMSALIAPAKARGLRVHVDGARLANAVAAGFDPRALARLGVDVLVLGGAKAGAGCVEALVVFDPALARRLDNRLKQAGQMASKGRFLAASLVGLLESGGWVRHAAHANAMAQTLAAGIQARTPYRLTHPVMSNTVFVDMPEADLVALNARGWAVYRFDDGSVRFVTHWATEPHRIEALLADLATLHPVG
ncbi:MAG: threonine aldolase family protein [Asticcacaulis sp.]